MLHLIKERSTLGSFEKFLPYLFLSKEVSTKWKEELLIKIFKSEKSKKLSPKLLSGLESEVQDKRIANVVLELYYPRVKGNLHEQKTFVSSY